MWTARTVHSRVGTEGRSMDVEVGKADDRLAAAMTPAAGADLATSSSITTAPWCATSHSR